MTRLSLAASLLAILVASPATADTIEADHNGSTMAVTVNGRDLSISYETPREGLRKAGFKRGTGLVSATIEEGGRIVGQARAFSSKCGWTGYPVEGQLHAASGVIELRGTRGGPKWDSGCGVFFTFESAHTELLFEASPAVLASIDPDAARARTGAEMATILQQPAAVPVAVKTPEPVAETVEGNETQPPAPVVAEQTEDQIEEARMETELYSSPEFQAEVAAVTAAAEQPSSPTPPSAEPAAAPEPPKRKLTLDF